MDSNHQIISIAVGRYSLNPKVLLTLFECSIDIPTPAFVCFPSTQEMNDLILRGGEFNTANRDKIKLEDCTLHYNIILEGSCVLVYLCLAGPALKGHLAQEFLGSVQSTVNNNPIILNSLPTANYHQFQKEMNPMLRELMMEGNKTNIFKNSTSVDMNGDGVQPLSKVGDLQKQVQEVKTVMSDNMIRILERGDRLENLDHRTEALHASSQNFKTTARRVQQNMCWKNLKWTIILSCFLTLLAVMIIVFILNQLGVFGGK